MALTRPRAYQIYDIDYKQAVRVVAISNVTLSGGAPNSVDGVSLSLNDRVLVTGQSSAAQNGIYYVTTVGSGSNGTWARSTDTNATGELLSGTIVMVTEGSTYADTQWKLTTNDPIVIGSTALTFVQNYLANSISFGQTSFAIGSSNADATVSVAGISNIAVFSTDGANITGSLTATGNITSVGNISGSYIIGNGSQLTGLPASYANSNVSAYLASGDDTANIITTGNITGGNITSVGNISGSYLLGNGSQLTGILTGNSFGVISVSGQSDVVADQATDTLTLAAGTGIAITTDAGTDTITISSATDSIFATGGDMGTVDEAVTSSEDLGLVTDAATIEYELGTESTSGIITPSLLLLPSYTVSGLGSLTAAPAGQFVFCSDESGGSIPAFSDGTNWRRVSDRAIVS